MEKQDRQEVFKEFGAVLLRSLTAGNADREAASHK